jgi:hypothetical protein
MRMQDDASRPCGLNRLALPVRGCVDSSEIRLSMTLGLKLEPEPARLGYLFLLPFRRLGDLKGVLAIC